MEQYVTAETRKNWNLRSKHYVWMVWIAQTRILEQRTTSSGIHDQEVLDSLSDRPWKEKEGWNANRRLLLNWPDPIRFGNVQCQSHWMGESPIPGLCNVLYPLGDGRAFYQRFLIYPCVIPVEAYTRRGGAGRTISKRTLHSLDREDRRDPLPNYSNSKSSDRIGISISIRSELSYWIAHSMSILNIMPWRGLEPPRSLARDFESRVSTISPPRHLESASYSMNMISI